MKHRTLLLRGITALPALVALAASSVAHAQADLNIPLPNVMLLVDTSGSMEYKADGSLPTCSPGNTAGTNDRSRWVDIIEVLTGTIDNYTCDSVDRTSSAFKTGEYALGGTPPYDYLYPLAYHRPISNNCTPGPGTQSSNPFIYSGSAIGYHVYNTATTCTNWSQVSKDGLLDAYRNDVRFGLMTFDTSVDAGVGYTGTMASATANSTTGKAGLWSYTVGTVPKGMPAGCTLATPPDQEVGARNAAAPAWEGRMVNFGNPYDAQLAYPIKNDHIQEVLRATRPYGATPIAGMLRDAADFFLNDQTGDPDRYPASVPVGTAAADFGPYRDPYVVCPPPQSRKQIIILLTDGQPNMDLRPFCAGSETPAGVCPFNKPEDIAAALNTKTPAPLSSPTYSMPAHTPIPTYVVGFALDQVDHDNNASTPNKDCTTLTPAEIDASSPTSLCGNPANANNAPLQACCTLQRIAIAGGTGRAFFSSDKNTLRSQLDSIVSFAMPATSRTQPVSAGGGSGSSSGGGMRFYSGFVPRTVAAWQGTLQRQRIICDDANYPGVPTPQKITEATGDDFERNVAITGNPDSRRIYTVLGGATVSDPLKPASTIRPLIPSDRDGVGTYGGRSYADLSRPFIDNLPTGATQIPVANCVNQNQQALTTAACQKQVLEWWAGYNNGQSTVLSRCVGAPECHLLGDIMHSTPAVVDRPISAIRDESFTRFSNQQKLRPKMLYTSTNDGMLHAFKVASNDATETDNASRVLTKVNNELWTFVPPAVLPVLYTLYPHTHQVLLDGVPTVMNVVAQPAALATDPPTVFERSQLAAQQGSATWRTVLVQSFGKIRPGYFALDVTNPVPSSSSPNDTNKGGPRMLWQLTGDKTDKNLFGSGGGTPTITTLLFDPDGGSNIREIPVAILPGGPGGAIDNSIVGGCPTGGRSFSDVSLDSSYPPRSKVRCYTYPNNDMGARSLTIVRLDTGEIIRTFRQSKTEVATELQGKVTEVGIDSPIVGQPSAFPGFTGEVADRIFVGDLDGRVWRLNVASPKPADWTMKLFMDTYPTTLPAPSPGPARVFYAEGQPIVTAPVVSVDSDNNLVLNVSTGDQDSLGAASPLYNYVYSLTEKVNAAHTAFQTKVNWYYEFKDGERVVGPMVLFNRQLFFGTYLAAPTSDVCTLGTSTIWGMDYLTPFNTGSLGQGGLTAVAITPPNSPPQKIRSFTSTVAIGPQLLQQPSCATEVDTLLGDGLVGFGHQVSMTNIQTGAFQLVFQTGSNTTGSKADGGAIGVQTIDLPPPPALSTVSGWASIVE